MTGTRQTIQYSLALERGDQGETPVSGYQGAEPVVVKPAPESPALTEQLMEEVCDRANLVRAWKRVRQNKGSPGVDGMTIDDAQSYLREHWPRIRCDGALVLRLGPIGLATVVEADRGIWGRRETEVRGEKRCGDRRYRSQDEQPSHPVASLLPVSLSIELPN